jgi:hypothetical protein
MSADPDGDAARAKLLALLDKAAVTGRTLRFWWRDDDAEDATPALDRLIALAAQENLPLALAVVPKGATEALAARLELGGRVAVLQHGWAHDNHAAEGAKKIELGGTQPLAQTREELRRGREKLETLFPKIFLPVLVPPWNRISEEVRAAIGDLGLVGLSTAGPADAARQVNIHVDIFAWRPARRPLTRAEAYSWLSAEVERRIGGSEEPVGILTHHLVHEDASWLLLDELFEMLARHKAARWPEIGKLFGF